MVHKHWQLSTWLLMLIIALLIGLINYVDAFDCKRESQLATLKLSRSHVLRIWQSDGANCRWWDNHDDLARDENRVGFETGPRWLVMQLREPMVLEAVSLQAWDGQWQSASSTSSSSVSAFVASSLSLQLQLQDPCRASWEVFGSSDSWKRLGSADSEKPIISYILLNSSSPLNYSAVKLTGIEKPHLELSVTDVAMCPGRNLDAMGDGATICFSIRGCSQQSEANLHGQLPGCFIKGNDSSTNGGLKLLRTINVWESLVETQYSLEAKHRHHNRVLKCSNGRLSLERTLGIIADPSQVRLSVSPVWVRGRVVTINFTSYNSYPEPQHQCQISISGGPVTNMTPNNMTRWPTKSKLQGTVASVTSFYSTLVSDSLYNASISCNAILENQFIKKIGDHFSVAEVSEPCKTEIYLGDFSAELAAQKSRQIHVTSNKCSIWSVSHSCWLVNERENRAAEFLQKIKQDSFISIHLLPIREWMQSSGWLVRCSINQSGVAYPTVKTKPVILQGPTGEKFDSICNNTGQSNGVIFLVIALVASVVLIVATVLLVTFMIRNRRRRSNFGKITRSKFTIETHKLHPGAAPNNSGSNDSGYEYENEEYEKSTLPKKRPSNHATSKLMKQAQTAGTSADSGEYVDITTPCVTARSRSLPGQRLAMVAISTVASGGRNT